MFLAYKGVFQIDDSEIYQVMNHCKKIGCLPMVHAENGNLVVEGQKKMISLGILGPEGHPQSRPSAVESEATHRAITIAGQIGVPLYVVHVMSKDAMEEIRRGREKGQIIYGEPILSGLALDDSWYYHKDKEVAMRYVMSPPIRSKEDQKALRFGLKSGVLNLVGTDHCTFTQKQKLMGLNDFTKIPNGVNGVEDRMNVLWSDLVNENDILSPKDYVRVTSTKAAQIFNIYPRKGAILEGSDADVIILDPNKNKTISAKTHHQNLDYNVYEGKKIKGVVITTISRGVVVWENDKLSVEKGAGRFVECPKIHF